MSETPICASVERDLDLSFDEITGPRPEAAAAVPAPRGPVDPDQRA